MSTYYFHRHGRQFFFGHGDDADARAYLARLNHERTGNLWAMRAEAGKPRGIDLGAELAKHRSNIFLKTPHD